MSGTGVWLREDCGLSELYRLTDAQTSGLYSSFRRPAARAGVDHGRVLRGIIIVQRNGVMWDRAPADHGPPRTIDSRWRRWSRLGVFATIMTGLAARARETRIVMIDATDAKAHRAASSSAVQKGVRTVVPQDREHVRPHQGRAPHRNPSGPMSDPVPSGLRTRCDRHLSVARPDPCPVSVAAPAVTLSPRRAEAAGAGP